MNLFVVDDEKHALNYLVGVLEDTYPQAEIFPFCKTSEAIEAARKTECDVAFLDIRIDEKNGKSTCIYCGRTFRGSTAYCRYAACGNRNRNKSG